MAGQNRVIRLINLLQTSFLGLLVLRSLTEAFPGLSIYLGPTTMNLSVAVVLVMDLIGLIYLGLLWARGEWPFDRVGSFLAAWVLSLAPWVYIAAAGFGIPGLTGAREWVRLLSLALLYLVVLAIARRTNYERIINICLLALPIPLGVTYYQIISSPGGPLSLGARAFGTMVHPNNLAAFLVVMVALTIWKLGRDHHSKLSWSRRLLWGGLLSLELPALIAPISSNGWLMLGAFLLTLAFLVRGRRFKLLAIAIGAVLLTLFIFISSQNINIQKEIMQNLRALGYQSLGAASGEGTLEWRFRTWGELIGVWLANPLRGYGLNTTYFVNPEMGKAAHNDFVRYLVEGGIFGLLLFLLFQVAVGRELFRLRRYASDPHRQFLAGIGFSLFLTWAIGSIGDNVIAYTVFQVYFWALLAAVSAAAAPSTRPYQVRELIRPRGRPRLRLGSWLRQWISALGRCISSYTRIWPELAPKGGKKAEPFLCPRCQTPTLTPSDAFCQRCFAPLLAPGSLFGLVLLIFLLIGAIGFYLWNQGAGLEAFFTAWLLLYVLLVTLLKRQQRRYIPALLATAMVGLIASHWLFDIPERNFQSAVWLSVFGLLALGLYGLITSWWAVSRTLGRSPWQTLPALLLSLGLLSLGAQMVPRELYPEVLYLFNYQLSGGSLWGLREASLGGEAFPVPLSVLLGGLAGLALLGLALRRLPSAMTIAHTPISRGCSLAEAKSPHPYLDRPLGKSLPPAIQVPANMGLAFWSVIGRSLLSIIRGLQALLRLPGLGLKLGWWLLKRILAQLGIAAHSLIGMVIFYIRSYLIPLGALFASAYTLNFILQGASAFIYGKPGGFGHALTGLFALFIELGLFTWGITGEQLRAALRSLAISYGATLGLVQIATLVSTGVLWALARLLPAFSATERFAPLLHERPLGLYTWVTLGLMVLMAVSYILFKGRLAERERGGEERTPSLRTSRDQVNPDQPQ